jgi:hypothetical protein
MAGRPTKLTGAVLETIVGHIRAGACGWVAAEAAGISERTFYNWLTRGERGEAPYAAFEAQVRQARAQARLAAELRVHAHCPPAWLRYGPGRARRGHPGWTEPVEELAPEETGHEDPDELDELARALSEAGWDQPTPDPDPHPNTDPAPAHPRLAEFGGTATGGMGGSPAPGHTCCACPRPSTDQLAATAPEREPEPEPQPVVASARIALGRANRGIWPGPEAGGHLPWPGHPPIAHSAANPP